MLNKLTLLASLVCLHFTAKAQFICNCSPSTIIEHQSRTEAKHIVDYSVFHKKRDTINVRYIYTWEQTYNNITSKITVKPTSRNCLRQSNSPEDSFYCLKGYLWFVKMEENDCDYHMEIGTANPNDTRIVVEVAQENAALQQKIKAHLDSLNLKIKNCGHGSSTDTHFEHGLPVIVAGLGFYDASHKPNTNHGDEHTKKFSWELHPVKSVFFLNSH
jgi:hypothetical protein